MKKFYLVLGLGLGFVLGSRAGHQPYEQLEGRAKEFIGKPDVEDEDREGATCRWRPYWHRHRHRRREAE